MQARQLWEQLWGGMKSAVLEDVLSDGGSIPIAEGDATAAG